MNRSNNTEPRIAGCYLLVDERIMIHCNMALVIVLSCGLNKEFEQNLKAFNQIIISPILNPPTSTSIAMH